jgi:hypothetical protein
MLMRADTQDNLERKFLCQQAAEQKQRELIKAHESRHSRDNLKVKEPAL